MIAGAVPLSKAEEKVKESSEASASVKAETQAEKWMAKGVAHDIKLEAKAALLAYQEVEKLEPQNPTLMVRMARQYRHLMADASSKEERIRLGNLALEYGRRAAAYGPRDSDAQLSTAISYGKMQPLLSTKSQLESSRQIKVSVDKALALDPNNDLAWHILGRWHRSFAEVSSVKRTLASMVYDAELPQCTHEDSVKCFQTAIRINPKRLMHYIELGTTYHSMEREVDAKKFLNHGLAMPSVEKDDPDLKKRGREVLAKIK